MESTYLLLLGLILLVVIIVLCFFPLREGLENPPIATGCPANSQGITSKKKSGGLKVRLYTRGECKTLGGTFTGNGKTTWGMENNDVGECTATPGGQNISFCNQSSPPSAEAVESQKPRTPVPAPATSFNDMTLGAFIELLQRDIKIQNPTALETYNKPNVPVGSLLNTSTPGYGPSQVAPLKWTPVMNATIPGPNTKNGGWKTPEPYDEIPKSSLVPCTCPTYSMSCPIHAGSRPASQVPGSTTAGGSNVPEDTASALSKAQDQYDMMRPFNNTDSDVPGFLNTFSAFA
jgi:hypothetical protein